MDRESQVLRLEGSWAEVLENVLELMTWALVVMLMNRIFQNIKGRSHISMITKRNGKRQAM